MAEVVDTKTPDQNEEGMRDLISVVSIDMLAKNIGVGLPGCACAPFPAQVE